MESNYFVTTIRGVICVIHEQFFHMFDIIGEKDNFLNCLQAAAWKQVLTDSPVFIHITDVTPEQWAYALSKVSVFVPFQFDHQSYFKDTVSNNDQILNN